MNLEKLFSLILCILRLYFLQILTAQIVADEGTIYPAANEWIFSQRYSLTYTIFWRTCVIHCNLSNFLLWLFFFRQLYAFIVGFIVLLSDRSRKYILVILWIEYLLATVRLIARIMSVTRLLICWRLSFWQGGWFSVCLERTIPWGRLTNCRVRFILVGKIVILVARLRVFSIFVLLTELWSQRSILLLKMWRRYVLQASQLKLRLILSTYILTDASLLYTYLC